MSRKAGDKFRNSLEERKGTEWYDSASKVGDLHDPHMSRDGKTERYSGAEIRAELRHGRGDKTVDSMVDHYEKEYASGNINLNGNAKEFLREKHGAVLERMKDGGDETPTPTPDPTPTPTPGPSPITGSPGSQGVSQDNDVTINGDGNRVNQDNSVTQNIDNSIDYGDSSRSFTYTGSGEGGVYDSPVSAATMGGYYDADDSPAASAKFLGKYINANNLAQKGMRDSYNSRTDTDYKAQADSVNQFNPESMQERIDREPLINRSRSTVDFAKLFGDVDNWQMKWEPTTAPSKIESEVGDIADEYKDDLD